MLIPKIAVPRWAFENPLIRVGGITGYLIQTVVEFTSLRLPSSDRLSRSNGRNGALMVLPVEHQR